jgi:subtilisin family serine protease
VVQLRAPALANAPLRMLSRLGTHPDLNSPLAQTYLRGLATQQAALEARIHRAIPSAQVRWRYRLVLDALAVVVPVRDIPLLSRLAGVRSVVHASGYAPALDRSVPLINAPEVWGPTLATAGQGMKIGIVDDGIDQTHPFLSPSGFSYPPGFPKGQTKYTTPKVIVARSFPAPSPLAVNPTLPFDPQNSDHATHVSGIAAGDHGTIAVFGGAALTLSGVAPRAYLGNYKVMSVPTPGFGIDGNSPEIAKGIDSAVSDGMNVINLSLGEPEVTMSRDIVVQAIEGATKLGVVVTVSAGNDYDDFGDGSIDSPGTAPDAITVAASGDGRGFGLDQIAGFSSGGPTPISLQLKPDVTAPGVQIVSSLPAREGLWAAWEGTSMAAPHVAGAAALLLQRHPGWSPAQVKSALVLTGHPVYTDAGQVHEVSPLREGGGRIDVAAADKPLLFAQPTNVSFGLARPGSAPLMREIELTDAGGGAGTWSVSLAFSSSVSGARVTVPSQVTVPGAFSLAAKATAAAKAGDEDGFIVLRNSAGITRRIPFWMHVEKPRLQTEKATLLRRPGVYSGSTVGKPSRVSEYRYPTHVPGSQRSFSGPEQVFRFTVGPRVANAGVVVISPRSGGISPHVVAAADENRLTGYAGLPININPYQEAYGFDESVAAVDLPAAGSYDAVFDTPNGAKPHAFRFRFWVNDTTPPTVRLLTPTVRAGDDIRFSATDNGSGVDPQTMTATLDGRTVSAIWDGARGTGRIATSGIAAGKHQLVLTVADYQEAKNMENTGAVLPNTRTFRAAVTIG